jgi:xanthine/CO dehydrogenase XdhC/CoxF family maturation factor
MRTWNFFAVETPAGHDLGAITPEVIALSILSEIAPYRGQTGSVEVP